MDNKLISDTRERILDVAERQFMENGYEAISTRAITSVAELNLGSINYHFGSKEGLLREVFRRRLAWLNKERVECQKLALFRTLPDVPRAEILWRLHFMLGAMSYATAGTDILHVITGHEMADTPGKDESAQSEAKRLSERLMPFFLGGLRAPLPQFGAPADPSFPSLDSPQQTNPQEAD